MLTAVEANRLSNQKYYINIDKYMSEIEELIRERCLDGCKVLDWDYDMSQASATEVFAIKYALRKYGYDVKESSFNNQLVIRW